MIWPAELLSGLHGGGVSIIRLLPLFTLANGSEKELNM